MAAFGGIAAAVPPAFMACVQAFELVQFGRNFKTDFAIPAADLKICEIHLLRWGTAAGLSEAAKGKPPDRLSRYPDDQLKKALQVLERIRDSFETTKKECRFESLDDEEDNGGEDLSGENTEPLEEKRELEHQSQDMKLSHKHLDKVRAKYRSAASAVK